MNVLSVTGLHKLDIRNTRLKLISLASVMQEIIIELILEDMKANPLSNVADIRNKYRQKWHLKFLRAMTDTKFLAKIMFNLTGEMYLSYEDNIYSNSYVQAPPFFAPVISKTKMISVFYVDGVPCLQSNCNISNETYDTLCNQYWQGIVDNKPDILAVELFVRYK